MVMRRLISDLITPSPGATPYQAGAMAMAHAITTADGPFWKSDAAVAVVFPVAFQAKPAVCVTLQNSSGTVGLLHRGNSAVSTLGFSAQFWALSSTTVTTLRWAYHAVGQ